MCNELFLNRRNTIHNRLEKTKLKDFRTQTTSERTYGNVQGEQAARQTVTENKVVIKLIKNYIKINKGRLTTYSGLSEMSKHFWYRERTSLKNVRRPSSFS